jgi:hypothetical protein
VGQARHGRPFSAVYAVTGHSGERLTRRHLHSQQPIQLPPALLDQRFLGEDGSLPRRPTEQRQNVEHLPHGDAAADGVLAVIAGVIPATGYIQTVCRSPPRIQACGFWSGPCRNRGVSSVRRNAGMASGSAIARGALLIDRAARSKQVEQS